MSGPEQNGRIRLSWSQIVWAIGTLAVILAQWYDTRTQIALSRQAFELRAHADDKEHERLWEAIGSAHAAPTQPPQTQRRKP